MTPKLLMKPSLLLCVLLLCVHSMEIEPFTIENIEVDVGDVVKCMPQYNSGLGYPSACNSDRPMPIRISATIKTKANVTWYGDEDWDFWVEDMNMTAWVFDYSKCIWGSTNSGKYAAGKLLAITMTCYEASKNLEYGDHIYISAFENDRHLDKNWLGFGIPLLGFSTPEMIEALPKRERRPLRPRQQKPRK